MTLLFRAGRSLPKTLHYFGTQNTSRGSFWRLSGYLHCSYIFELNVKKAPVGKEEMKMPRERKERGPCMADREVEMSCGSAS